MIQTWILRDNGKVPHQNLGKADVSICGDCIHRCGTCYVNTAQAPTQVYKAYKRGSYEKFDLQNFRHIKAFTGRMLRIGSYGDGAAVPYSVWQDLVPFVSNWTGYTHQWRNRKFNAFRFLCMASVETEEQAKEANKLGFRTFRVKSSWQPKMINELVCPASVEAGHKKTCIECKACRGYQPGKPGVPNVVIDVHGFGWKIARYNTLLAASMKDKNHPILSLPIIEEKKCA